MVMDVLYIKVVFANILLMLFESFFISLFFSWFHYFAFLCFGLLILIPFFLSYLVFVTLFALKGFLFLDFL